MYWEVSPWLAWKAYRERFNKKLTNVSLGTSVYAQNSEILGSLNSIYSKFLLTILAQRHSKTCNTYVQEMHCM